MIHDKEVNNADIENEKNNDDNEEKLMQNKERNGWCRIITKVRQ